MFKLPCDLEVRINPYDGYDLLKIHIIEKLGKDIYKYWNHCELSYDHKEACFAFPEKASLEIQPHVFKALLKALLKEAKTKGLLDIEEISDHVKEIKEHNKSLKEITMAVLKKGV